jgi:hypothetical protein
MGRVESDIVRNQENENYRKAYVQWWDPMRKEAKNDEELYHNCWLRKWKCNHADPKQWVEIFFIMFFFSARNNTTINSNINIRATHASKAKANLDANNINSCAL